MSRDNMYLKWDLKNWLYIINCYSTLVVLKFWSRDPFMGSVRAKLISMTMLLACFILILKGTRCSFPEPTWRAMSEQNECRNGENWAVFCGVRHQGVLRPGSLRTTVLHQPVFSTAKECWFFILVVYLGRKKKHKRPLASATCSHKLTDALMAGQSHLPRNQFPCCWISLNSLWLGFFSDGMGGGCEILPLYLLSEDETWFSLVPGLLY